MGVLLKHLKPARPYPGEMDEQYDRFLKFSSWLNVLYYTAPAAGILVMCWIVGVPEKFWIPILLIYFIGAVADQLCYGFQAVNIQIKTCTGWMRDEMASVVLAEQLAGKRHATPKRDG